MDELERVKKLIVLLARNHKIEEIKKLLKMKNKTNEEFINWIELMLSFETYKEMFIREKIKVLARELKVENLPF